MSSDSKAIPLFLHLPFDPLMTVQAELDSPRCVAAYFDKQRIGVGIVYVEIVVVHVGRLVACELQLAVDLLALVGLRLFLCNANEHYPIANATLLPNLIRSIVFSFFVVELMDWNPLAFGLLFHYFTELFSDLSPYHWRWNRLAQLLAHEHHQSARCRQRAGVTVQVQPVQTLHLQSDVSIQKFGNARHTQDSTEFGEPSLVGLRSKTSLVLLRRRQLGHRRAGALIAA